MFCIVFSNQLPIRINLTTSMPRGIYLLSSSHTLHAGDLVMVCLNHSLSQFALQRGYLKAGYCKNGTQPLLKEVVALAGDTVRFFGTSTQINNQYLSHSTRLCIDRNARNLSVIPSGIYMLSANQLWLYGTGSIYSWDSRYFGLIDSSAVISIVKPLFIWSWRS